MPAHAPDNITNDDERQLWRDISRVYEEFCGPDDSKWTERRQRFANVVEQMIWRLRYGVDAAHPMFTPTVEINLAAAVFQARDINFLNEKIAELSPKPELVHVLIKNMSARGAHFECLPQADEPTFTVLGRDQLAQATVLYWLDRATAAGVPEDKLERARQRYREIVDFQTEHPERVKVPD